MMVDDGNPDIPLDEQPPEDSPGHDLLAFATNRADSASIPPAHLARMMSEAINRNSKKPGSTRKTNVAISHVNYSSVLYSVSRSAHVSTTGGALVDGGSNGGLAGSEMRVIETYDNGRTVDIEGIDRHRMCRIPLGSAGAVVKNPSNQDIVWVHTGPEVFEARPARTVALDGAHVSVVNGLKAGDRVVTQGAPLVNQVR